MRDVRRLALFAVINIIISLFSSAPICKIGLKIVKMSDATYFNPNTQISLSFKLSFIYLFPGYFRFHQLIFFDLSWNCVWHLLRKWHPLVEELQHWKSWQATLLASFFSGPLGYSFNIFAVYLGCPRWEDRVVETKTGYLTNVNCFCMITSRSSF